jgi:hypothetical protein
MYWAYHTEVTYWRRQMVQARLVTPPPNPLSLQDCGFGFKSPQQAAPYGVDLRLIYRIRPRHPRPDNHLESFGFDLFSERLVALMAAFGVRHEAFPATLVDPEGVALPEPYFVFHALEPVIDAMDHAASGWTGDRRAGVARVVLAEGTFEPRPLFVLDHLYLNMMRDDLKQEIRRQGITGFRFLDPTRYRSGSYGLPPEYTD